MNDDDIYNAFADAYVKETLTNTTTYNQKQKTWKSKQPKNKEAKKVSSSQLAPVDTTRGLFGGLEKENDLESNNQFGGALGQSIPNLKKKVNNMFSQEVKEQSQNAFKKQYQNLKQKLFKKNADQQNQNPYFQLISSSGLGIPSKYEKRDTPKAFICFAICAFFFMMALLNIPSLILAPQMFNLFFTIAMISAIAGLAFMNGPVVYARKMGESKNIVASTVLIISIVMSLYFSIVSSSYLMSLIFCFIQLNAVILFFFNTFPAGKAGMKMAHGAAKTMLSSNFR
eukprot:403344619